MRVLELYSGIGGMHWALQSSGLQFEVVAALDINNHANRVYNSFSCKAIAKNRTIESLSEDECLNMNADLWTMSPPCQPFTRMGKQKQGNDSRSTSFASVIELIKRLKPKAILLENVKGFDGSDPWLRLLEALTTCDYDIRQFLLSPLQFGIPNCRLRFYLVAKLRNSPGEDKFNFGTPLPNDGDLKTNALKMILEIPPTTVPTVPHCECAVCTGKAKNITSVENHFEAYLPICRPVKDFLLSDGFISASQYLGRSELVKYYRILDIVTPETHKSACFTKGYAQRYEGTGSFLKTAEAEAPETGDNLDNFPKLRSFNSKEIANLMCFPSNFAFPEDVSEKQRIRLLGNSINVLVVAHIMRWVFEANDT